MADDPKKTRVGTGDRDRKTTPAFGLPTPEATIERIGKLIRTLERTVDLCRRVEQLVREGGFDARSRAFLMEVGEHFEEQLPPVSIGTGRVLKRLAKS